MTYAAEVLADSPAIYWRLGDTSGTTAVDSSGNSKDGTYANTPTLNQTGLLTGDADPSIVLTAASSEYATRAAQQALINGINTFTFEAWIKPTSTGLASFLPTICGFETSSHPNLFRLTNGSAHPEFVIDVSGGGTFVLTSSATLVAGTIYHVVAVYDGVKMYIYLNGALDISASHTGNASQDTCSFDAGRSQQHGRYWDGGIDEVAFYTTALSAARISAHYAAGTGGTSVTVTPAAVVATTAVLAPTIAWGTTPTPNRVIATAAVPAPTVVVPGNATVTPSAVVATANVLTASVSTAAAPATGQLHCVPTSFLPIR